MEKDWDNLSIARQKGESQNGGNKKTKHAKFSEKRKKRSLLDVLVDLKVLVNFVPTFQLSRYLQYSAANNTRICKY